MMATLGAEFDIKDMGTPCAANGFGFLVYIQGCFVLMVCRCPTFPCVELSTAMAPCFAAMMMPKSPPETTFFTDKLTHIMRLI